MKVPHDYTFDRHEKFLSEQLLPLVHNQDVNCGEPRGTVALASLIALATILHEVNGLSRQALIDAIKVATPLPNSAEEVH